MPQDKTAAQIVRLWAHAQRQLPDADPNAIRLAEQHANLMDAWLMFNPCTEP